MERIFWLLERLGAFLGCSWHIFCRILASGDLLDALLVNFGLVFGPSGRGLTPKNHAGAYTGARFRKNRDFPLELLLGPLLGSPGGLLGPSWGSWDALGALLGRSWGAASGGGGTLDKLPPRLELRFFLFGRSWGALGALLGRSWAALGTLLAALGGLPGAKNGSKRAQERPKFLTGC